MDAVARTRNNWRGEMIEVEIVAVLVIAIAFLGIFVSLELKWLRYEIKYITHAIAMLDSDLFILMKPQKDGENENAG